MRFFLFVFLFHGLLVLVACTSPPYDDDGLENIVPTAEKDTGPLQPVDLRHLPDPVPRVEPRTAAGNKSPYKVLGIVYRIMKDPNGYTEEGVASWYGRKFHGHTTANGEIYDMYALSAAHKTLPIPSYVRVTNLHNKKSIVVRVNDRGPFAHNRVIDLSYAAAQKLGYAHAGTATVKVEYLDPLASASSPPSLIPPTTPKLYLQVGAFFEETAALSYQLQASTLTHWPVNTQKGKTVDQRDIYRVQIGPLPDETSLSNLQHALQEKGLPKPLRVVR